MGTVFDDSDYGSPDFDYLCTDCGNVYHGPHTGLHFEAPSNVSSIDPAGNPYPGPIEGAAPVSHGRCPVCHDAFMAQYHRERRARFHRGKHSP